MFQLILITPEENHPFERAIIESICECYPVFIHVRKPSFSLEAYTSYLSSYSKHTRARFVLHEHHSLASSFSVKGIHLKETDRIKALKELFHSNSISTSFHHTEDLKGIKEPYSYVFFSPLFQSISKEHYGKDTSDASLCTLRKAIKEHTNLAVIGLGGINEETILRIKHCGFDGGAVLGAVWLSTDPLQAFERIIKAQ